MEEGFDGRLRLGDGLWLHGGDVMQEGQGEREVGMEGQSERWGGRRHRPEMGGEGLRTGGDRGDENGWRGEVELRLTRMRPLRAGRERGREGMERCGEGGG